MTDPAPHRAEPAHDASYLPHDIPYDAAYEDAVADLLLSAPANDPLAIHILPGFSTHSPLPPHTVLASSIPPSTLPHLDMPSLPLPLTDSRRKYASPIPGLRLTHPGGYFEGGPGVSPAEDEFAAHFLREHGVRGPDDVGAVVEREVARHMDEARERARTRKAAREKNDTIRGEIKALVEQMELETKVLNKARERARERRERKEARRKGGG